MPMRRDFASDDDFQTALRDYFAGQALVGLTMSQLTDAMTFETISSNAYRAADAMILMRKVEVSK